MCNTINSFVSHLPQDIDIETCFFDLSWPWFTLLYHTPRFCATLVLWKIIISSSSKCFPIKLWLNMKHNSELWKLYKRVPWSWEGSTALHCGRCHRRILLVSLFLLYRSVHMSLGALRNNMNSTYQVIDHLSHHASTSTYTEIFHFHAVSILSEGIILKFVPEYLKIYQQYCHFCGTEHIL